MNLIFFLALAEALQISFGRCLQGIFSVLLLPLHRTYTQHDDFFRIQCTVVNFLRLLIFLVKVIVTVTENKLGQRPLL